jgi:hypothetical protein
MTDFAAWNKFSVEDALKEVDEQVGILTRDQ